MFSRGGWLVCRTTGGAVPGLRPQALRASCSSMKRPSSARSSRAVSRPLARLTSPRSMQPMASLSRSRHWASVAGAQWRDADQLVQVRGQADDHVIQRRHWLYRCRNGGRHVVSTVAKVFVHGHSVTTGTWRWNGLMSGKDASARFTPAGRASTMIAAVAAALARRRCSSRPPNRNSTSTSQFSDRRRLIHACDTSAHRCRGHPRARLKVAESFVS